MHVRCLLSCEHSIEKVVTRLFTPPTLQPYSKSIESYVNTLITTCT